MKDNGHFFFFFALLQPIRFSLVLYTSYSIQDPKAESSQPLYYRCFSLSNSSLGAGSSPVQQPWP